MCDSFVDDGPGDRRAPDHCPSDDDALDFVALPNVAIRPSPVEIFPAIVPSAVTTTSPSASSS